MPLEFASHATSLCAALALHVPISGCGLATEGSSATSAAVGSARAQAGRPGMTAGAGMSATSPLQVALRELSRSERSIAELSERLGYASTQAFHRAFKRWTGIDSRRHTQAHARAQKLAWCL